MKWFKAWQRVTWLKKLLAGLSTCLVFWKTRKILIVFARPNTTPFVMIYAKNFKLFKKRRHLEICHYEIIMTMTIWSILYRTTTEIWKKEINEQNHVFNLSLKRFMVLDLGSLWQLRILARGPRTVRTTPITRVWTVWGALFSFFLHSHISRY